ncbi:MAG: lamin tail domain-containing protein [Candidatus Zhuqueibacterota bacterium]
MNKMRHIFIAVLFCVVLPGLVFAQERVLLGQYENPSTFSGAKYGGTNSIFFEGSQNYLVACSIIDYAVIYSMVSLDGGASWQTSEVVNTAASPQVRNPSVSGYTESPVILFDRRDAATTGEPWTRYKVLYSKDDFGWGGGAYSATQVGVSGTADDVLDSYIPTMDISPFDPNLWAVFSHHGSSQPGGEYQQLFVSVDGGQKWSDRIIVATANKADSLLPNYIADLTTNPADICFGPNGYIMVAGTGQWDFDFQGAEHLWYTISEDTGKTWSQLNIVPGTETIDVDWNVVDRGWNLLRDNEGNFHLFALASNGYSFGAYDFIWNGSEWTSKRFVEPQLIENGLVAMGTPPVDDDTAPLNAPTLNSDGTIFYSYIDVVDTTGGIYKYELFTVYSMDNGGAWSDPVQVLHDSEFNADEFVDVARDADGALHVVYCVTDTVGVDKINYYYQKVDLASLMSGASSPIIINEFMYDVTNDDANTPDINEGDMNGDGVRSVRGDEFVELYNTGDAAVDISGYQLLKRDLAVFFTFPANTMLDPGEFAVVFGGVGPNGFGPQFPPQLQLFAAKPGEADSGFAGNDGSTNLIGSNDNIILVNPAAQDTIAEVCWGTATVKSSVGQKLEAPNTVGGQTISGSIHQSVTRNPEFTGLWDLHTQASVNGYYQSPGSTIDAPFVIGEVSPIVLNEFMFDVTSDDANTPDINEGDINGDGVRSVRGDEFVELYNSGNAAVDISGYQLLKRDLTAFFTFPANTMLDPGEFTVVFGGVGPNGFGAQFPTELQLFAAVPGDADAGFAGADGTSNLSNSNDNILLVNPAAQDTIAEVFWGSATAKSSVGQQLEAPNTVGGQSITGAIHQSVVRNPDFTGLWDLHAQASTNGYSQSPGSTIDAPFITSVDHNGHIELPEEYALYQNYPNPFNPTTTIQFDLKNTTRVFLSVYSITGQRIASLISNQTVAAGRHSVVWDAQQCVSGIYYYKLQTQDGYSETRKMILIK